RPTQTQIVAVGGIDSGLDMLHYESVEASAFQVTSAFLNEPANDRGEGNPAIFGRILAEYLELKNK
ncbi:MAG: hypothetical protein AAB776_04460, partial [Patescibacteria group bacterium]